MLDFRLEDGCIAWVFFSYFELFMSVLVSFTFYTETGIEGDVISRYPMACILCSLNISVRYFWEYEWYSRQRIS